MAALSGKVSKKQDKADGKSAPTDTLPPVDQAKGERQLSLNDIADALIGGKLLSADQVPALMLAPKRRDKLDLHPLEIIADQKLDDPQQQGELLSLDRLSAWLADKVQQPYYRIDPLKIDVARVTEAFSFQFAQRHNILAVEMDDETVTIASAQPYCQSWESMLQHTLKGRKIQRVFVSPEDLRRYTLEFYTMARSVRGARDTHGKTSPISNLEQMLEIGQMQSLEANDAHIVNIVDWLLQYAFEQRASDIHIELRREAGRVRFRIDGILHDIYSLPPAVATAVISRLKILSRMDVAEKRRPQDGRIKTKRPGGMEVELRLSTLPTAFGEKMVMRVFDPDVLLRSFSDLGFGGEDLQRWGAVTSNPHGIVLVTGPTGSGKTTTLYSTLKSLATPEVNVCTIEDPIEMVEPTFNQMQVQQNIDLTFAAGVRALLRQDPDIIMIGEIRDLETAQMAVQAALTGHLVLSTLHTNDAPSAITRLLELNVPAYLIRATVLGVLAQRLVRTLCPHCKQSVDVDMDGWQAITAPQKVVPPEQFCAPVGCSKCRDTGYSGRIGLHELLTPDNDLRRLITDHCELDQLRQVSARSGMRTLRLSGALQVGRGRTTVEEVLRVLPLAESLD